MIYTGYFATLRKMPENIVPVSICVYPPKGYKGLKYSSLAPTAKILNDWKQTKDECRYIADFQKEVLDRLSPEKVVSDLERMCGTKDVCLVCYEKSEDFCHRHLVAKWLMENGIPCEEYAK